MKCQADELGTTPLGDRVIAATDSAGPQVIVKGEERHLLSLPLKDHEAAVELGKRVVTEGHEIYHDWYNLRQANLGEQLFAVFGGPFRTKS